MKKISIGKFNSRTLIATDKVFCLRSSPSKLNAVSYILAFSLMAFSLSGITPALAANNGGDASVSSAGLGGVGVDGAGSGGNGGIGISSDFGAGGGGGAGGSSSSRGFGGSGYGNPARSGGAGGLVGVSSNTLNGDVTGFNGSRGTDVVGALRAPGGGGGGGVGFWVLGNSSIFNPYSITGGRGGSGSLGDSYASGSGGGGGGAGIGGIGSFTLTNAGTITGGAGRLGGNTTATNANGGNGGNGGSGVAGGSFTLSNVGTISGGDRGLGGTSQSGTAGSAGFGGAGVSVLSGSGVSISNLTGGTIKGGSGANASGTGVNAAINNAGTINNLVNAQGVGNAYGALTYTGNLPTNYKVIVNSPTSYGQLKFIDITSTAFNFGIDSSSVLALGTYTDVLQGLSSISNVTGSSGSFGAYRYSLQSNTGVGAVNDWNLVVSVASAAVPEIDGALIPQVGLLIGSLFLILGRRKENTEPILAA